MSSTANTNQRLNQCYKVILTQIHNINSNIHKHDGWISTLHISDSQGMGDKQFKNNLQIKECVKGP